MPDDDPALLQRAREGDHAALGQLLSAHQGRVYGVCLRMVRHPDDAAELAQDTLVKVVQKLGDFRGDARFSTWVTRIAMNLSLSHLRKRKLRQTVSLDQPAHAAAVTPRGAMLAGGELPPDQRVEEAEMQRLLQSALGRLEPDQRAVLVLRDLQQLDYAEIARALELPVGTVKSRLFRARLALRQMMEHHEPDGPR
jgi:RNA polymerase sigma-70 factor (ECF subfamily)